MLMDIKKRYEYFLARLNHEVKKLGHGGKAYIGKNTGSTGAYIGQLLNNSLKKKASDEIQIAIAQFICGSESRFIEEGCQILTHGYILSEVKPPLPPIIDIQDEALKKHQIVIEGFENREKALSLNQMIVEIEKLEGDAGLDAIGEFIEFRLNKAREKKGLPQEHQRPTGTK